MLAFSTDTAGDERYLLQIKDLRTGEMLGDQIPQTSYGATWDLAGEHLFYTTVDDAWRTDKVWRHKLGTDTATDELVHHETDDSYWVSVGRTRSDRFLVIAVGSKITSEYRIVEADDPTGEFRVVAPRRHGIEYGVEHAVIGGQDQLLVLHNDDALNFEIARAPIDATSHEQWEPFIAHDPAVRLEDIDAFADQLVISQRSDGLTQLRVLDLGPEGVTDDYLMEFPEQVYTVGLGGNPEFAAPTLRVGHTTLATPPAIYDYNTRTRILTLLKRTPVLDHPVHGPFDANAYEQFREWATAPDGTRVPLSVIVPRAHHGTGRPRSCFTGTARTRPRWTPRSRSHACRCWIAAWGLRSRTFAAVASWAGPGTTTASCCASAIPSPISSPAPSTWPIPDSAPPTESSPRAAVPVAC